MLVYDAICESEPVINHIGANMSDSKYQLVESVGNKLIPVTSYESLHIHHPSANAKGLKTGNEVDFERPGGSTSYPIISGVICPRIDGHLLTQKRGVI